LGDRGGQRDDQHDDKHRDEENSSPPGVEIHWYYRAWEPTLLFNNQQRNGVPTLPVGRRYPGQQNVRSRGRGSVTRS
jgi:hypothetical protein